MFRVGDVLRLQRRQVEVDPLAEYEEIGVRSFGRGIFHKAPVLGADLGNKRVFEIYPGDLILSNVFAWEGAVALASDSEAGKIGSHRFMTYVVDSDVAEASYLRFFFASDEGVRLLSQASPGSAGRNRTLAVDRFAALRIPLPGLDEQRRVADRLESLRPKLEHLEQRTASGLPANPAELMPAIIRALLARVSVAEVPLHQLVDPIADTVEPGEDPTPAKVFVGLQHISRHTGLRIGHDELGNEHGPKSRFAPGDIVYPRLRPYLNKVWLADCHGLCSTDQYVLRPNRQEDALVLSYAMRGSAFLAQAVELTSRLQHPRIRVGDLLSINVAIVPVDGRRRVEETLGRLQTKVVRAAELRRNAHVRVQSLSTAILNREFGGEL